MGSMGKTEEVHYIKKKTKIKFPSMSKWHSATGAVALLAVVTSRNQYDGRGGWGGLLPACQ